MTAAITPRLRTMLKGAAENGEIVDLSSMVLALNGDLNCLMVFGRKYVDRDLDEKGFKGVIMETLDIGERFNLADYFPYIGALDLQGMNSKMKALSKIFDGCLEKIIDDHVRNKEEKKQNKDFVDTMMGIMESGEADFEFDRRHVKAVLLELLIAGMDTSETALEWALSELIRHAKIMKKLQQELESVVGMDHMVEESHLRLYPVVSLLIPHESMEDCVVDGFHIPKGSRTIVSVLAIGRDPNVWSNPKTFSPERFIDSNIDMKGQHFQLLPFGSGRRNCLGMQLGLTMVRLVLAQLAHCFDWELPNDMKPAELDMSEHFGLVTGRSEHLMAVPTYRLRK